MTSKRHVMFGFFKNIIRVTVIIFAIIGFIAIGGLSFIQKHFNFESGKNQDSKIEKAEKIADFSKLNGEFEIISSGSVPFTGDYVYTKHTASDQKSVFLVLNKQETLTKDDFSSQKANTKITDFVKNFKILNFKFENFKITGKENFKALNQTIPYVKFEADVVNLPVSGTQGIIGAAKLKDSKNAIILCFNTHGKYSQIITSVFLSEIHINK